MAKSLLPLLILCIAGPVLGQAKRTSAATSPFCTQHNALEMIREQAALTKGFNTTQRITVLIRATAMIKDKQFDEAERLAAKIEGLEQRAFLHVEIAKALNRSDTHAREVGFTCRDWILRVPFVNLERLISTWRCRRAAR